MTHEEKAAAYARIAEQARQDKLIAFCRAYEGDSTAHNLIKRLDAENAALRPVVDAAEKLLEAEQTHYAYDQTYGATHTATGDAYAALCKAHDALEDAVAMYRAALDDTKEPTP